MKTKSKSSLGFKFAFFLDFSYNLVMEIVKFKKLKTNLYEIHLNNETVISLYDDVIVKYNLLVNKKLDDKKLEEIVNYNNSLDAYYQSIKYINKKLRCEKEIEDYLKKKGYSKKIIDDTIKKLTKDGYLDHKLYIKSYINDSFNFKSDGPLKIKNNLMILGFLDDEIMPYLDKDFKEKVQKIIEKKDKMNHHLNDYMFKQKMNNYLINLGYPKDLFIDYLESLQNNDKNIIKKDTILLINKYSKKYEKDKLKYFIKDKLYKKGYNISEINEVLNEELL